MASDKLLRQVAKVSVVCKWLWQLTYATGIHQHHTSTGIHQGISCLTPDRFKYYFGIGVSHWDKLADTIRVNRADSF